MIGMREEREHAGVLQIVGTTGTQLATGTGSEAPQPFRAVYQEQGLQQEGWSILPWNHGVVGCAPLILDLVEVRVANATVSDLDANVIVLQSPSVKDKRRQMSP